MGGGGGRREKSGRGRGGGKGEGRMGPAGTARNFEFTCDANNMANSYRALYIITSSIYIYCLFTSTSKYGLHLHHIYSLAHKMLTPAFPHLATLYSLQFGEIWYLRT